MSDPFLLPAMAMQVKPEDYRRDKMGYDIPADHHQSLPQKPIVDTSDKVGPNREMNSAEKKSALLSSAQSVQQKIKDLQLQLQVFSPQAKSLVVTKELEKLLRAAEKVQMGLQELVL